MFRFIKKAFLTGLTILSSVNLLTVTPLRCIPMTYKECKVRPEIVNVNIDEPVFYPYNIKQVNEVVVVTISMILMQKCVLLMLLKTNV